MVIDSGRMRTITFYSYKGGVGRTLAAANFAVYLASLGQRTVLLDFDLEAPGLDSKFTNFDLPKGHRGILDYVVEYQITGSDPGSIAPLCIKVPAESALLNAAPIWLLPAGDYLSGEYSRKLSVLNWHQLFSEQGNGIAFFQSLLARIAQELEPEFLIVDSRTGISEISGLCTQQLADEVVMLSSMAAESIKVSRHIATAIRSSAIARELGKSIDVKVVVTRTARPADLESFKRSAAAEFGVQDDRLFFLFSSEALERSEYLALLHPELDEDLVADYARLFYGLNIDLAGENIRLEIDKAIGDPLKRPPDDVEKSIRELAALYPHPEVYRVAMRFYRLAKEIPEVRHFGWKLFDLVPNDTETLRTLADTYFGDDQLDDDDTGAAIQCLAPLWNQGQLTSDEGVKYAAFLEDLAIYDRSFDIAQQLAQDASLEGQPRTQARLIGARCALRLGRSEDAAALVDELPEEALSGALAALRMDSLMDADEPERALQFAAKVLRRNMHQLVLDKAMQVAQELDRVEELEDVVRNSEVFTRAKRQSAAVSGLRARTEGQQLADMLRNSGLRSLARELSSNSALRSV